MIVVFAHFLGAFHPWAVFSNSASFASAFEQRYSWEAWLHWPPLGLFTAGHFAVCLFFVLSGYVLCASYIGKPGQGWRIAGAIVKRPFRLAGLALMSLLIGAWLWSGDWLLHQEVGTLAGSSGWLEKFWVGQFSWSDFGQKLIRGQAGSEYNPPLWTIKIEVIGSFLVFFLLLAINWMPQWARLIIMAALIVLLNGTYYEGFVIGMLLADVFRSRAEVKWSGGVAIWIVSAVAIALASYPYYSVRPPLPGLVTGETTLSMVSASIVFVVVHRSLLWRRSLTTPVLIKLGELSYAIYVLHFLIIHTLTASLVLNLTERIGFGWASLIAGVLSLPVLFGLSALATRYVDRPCIDFGRWIESIFYRLVRVRPHLQSGSKKP